MVAAFHQSQSCWSMMLLGTRYHFPALAISVLAALTLSSTVVTQSHFINTGLDDLLFADHVLFNSRARSKLDCSRQCGEACTRLSILRSRVRRSYQQAIRAHFVNKQKQMSDIRNAHAAHTDNSLTSPPRTYTHTHTHTQTHTHMQTH